MAAKEAAIILSAHQSPWIHPTTTPSLIIWNTRNPIQNQFSKPKFPQLKSKNWKISAKAKGFNIRAPVTESPSQKKINLTGKSPDDNDEKIPQIVWNRMTTRILAYVGIPMATGIVLLQIFSVGKEEKLFDFPLWVPFLTSLLTFGASALGIAYGSLSTSWDAEKEGSVLGFEQVQKNWVELWKEDEDDDANSTQ